MRVENLVIIDYQIMISKQVKFLRIYSMLLYVVFDVKTHDYYNYVAA